MPYVNTLRLSHSSTITYDRNWTVGRIENQSFVCLHDCMISFTASCSMTYLSKTNNAGPSVNTLLWSFRRYACPNSLQDSTFPWALFLHALQLFFAFYTCTRLDSKTDKILVFATCTITSLCLFLAFHVQQLVMIQDMEQVFGWITSLESRRRFPF